MRRNRNAKIVATLGPASSTEAGIATLFEAGADVFRLNFSHGTHEGHEESIDIIRGLEKRYSRPIGIMLDLQGPKLRVGKFADGKVNLQEGTPFRLDLSPDRGSDERVSLPHPEIFDALEEKKDLLVDDGKIRLRVVRHGSDFAETEVITGGVLSDNKGVNVPDATLDLSPLSPKDREDLSFGLKMGIDWVALSFVQKPADVAEARELIDDDAAILVKLEKPNAIEHLYEIVDLADAVMVARGDLGVEVPPEDVPALQKRIVRACRYAGKPVVVATQMLESMVHSPMPTRAEASDVATAVYDGADAVMLSAESAVGKHPTEAVAMMERIIIRVENDPLYRKLMNAEKREPEATEAGAITAAARQVAHAISAVAIVTFSTSGSTTLRAARERPKVPVLGLTPIAATARRLALAWGVHTVLTEDLHSFGDMVRKAVEIASREGYAVSGERLVITAGIPFGTSGSTNILRIARVE